MSNALMKDRTRTLGPNGVVIQNWCDTEIKYHYVNYVWTIHGYLFHKAKLMKGEALKSPIFTAESDKGCKWFLNLYPNGKADSNNDNGSLFLKFDDTSEYAHVFGKKKLSILDENMKEIISIPDTDVEKFNRGIGWGSLNFIKSNHYESPLNNAGILTIYCEVTFSLVDNFTNTSDLYESITAESNVSERRVLEDLKQLLRNEECTDVVLTVNGKDYKAHKTILIARSPVFAAMFKYEDTLENQQNKVDITDFSERVVEDMLNYIYTGKPENSEELASDLLAVAEKYGLDGLKDISESVLMKNLSVDDAIDMLVFADLHRASKLKSYTINFIVAKFTEVMKTTAWKNIEPSKLGLIVEVCEALASCNR